MPDSSCKPVPCAKMNFGGNAVNRGLSGKCPALLFQAPDSVRKLSVLGLVRDYFLFLDWSLKQLILDSVRQLQSAHITVVACVESKVRLMNLLLLEDTELECILWFHRFFFGGTRPALSSQIIAG